MSQENSKNHLSYLQSINHIVFELNDSNIEASIDELVNLFDANYSYSINLELCHMILSSFRARKGNIHTNLRFLKKFHEKEESEKLFDQNPIEIFLDYINTRKSYPRHETIYLEEMLIEDGYYKADDLISNYSMFFIHHKPNLDPQEVPRFLLNLARSYGEGQDPIELHKKLFQEGVNPTKIAEIIRNDNVEQLQELSTQVGFSYNQTIERSHYETCVLLNRYSVSIVDYAAFFSAVKCFKYLHMNGADIHKTGEYAVAGGNIEIIHLCEQNNSSFEGAYVTAIEFHQNDIFKYIYENKLEESANLNVLGKKCIVCNNYEILSYLIEKNLEINDDIINKAAKTGNLFLVKYFLEKHQIPKNILAYATRTSNYELVEFIIKKDGIDINAKSIDGKTPLMRAMNEKIAKMILDNPETDVNAKDGYGQTALLEASHNGRIDVVKLLLQNEKTDINAKDDYKNTALLLAAIYNKIDVVKLLLEQKDIDYNAKNKSGRTLFFEAAEKGWADVLQTLLKHEDICENINENEEQNALNLAAKYNQPETTKILLEQEGINVNVKDWNGWTPLMHASSVGNTEVVKLLLEHEGIDLNVKSDDTRQNALILAIESENQNLEIIKLLLQQEGIQINYRDALGKTALMHAVENDKIEIVKLLLKYKGINLNVKDKEDEETALMYAARKGSTEIVKLLIKQKGINLNVKNNGGDTACSIASEEGHKDIVKLLKTKKK